MPAYSILSLHLEHKVHRREIVAERQDIEPVPLFLRARSREAANVICVDFVKPIAMLVERQTDRMWTVLERRVQHVDILVD